MIPVVDARSGKLVSVGETVSYPDNPISGWQLLSVEEGIFSADVVIMSCGGRVEVVPSPVKWFPRLTYGPQFPVGGLRAVVFPS